MSIVEHRRTSSERSIRAGIPRSHITGDDGLMRTARWFIGRDWLRAHGEQVPDYPNESQARQAIADELEARGERPKFIAAVKKGIK